MKSKVWIMVLAGVVLVGVGGYLFLGQKGKKTPPITAIPEEGGVKILPQPTGEKLLIWDDPAGFTFQYDPLLKINNHPEDNINYANLEMTEPGKEGKILVLAQDTKYKNVEEWATKDSKLKTENAADATLGGKPAKKISIADSKRVVIGAIDDKILFTIEVDPIVMTGKVVEQSYFDDWKGRFDAIVSSFKFVYPTPAVSDTSGQTSGDILEEEEIIE